MIIERNRLLERSVFLVGTLLSLMLATRVQAIITVSGDYSDDESFWTNGGSALIDGAIGLTSDGDLNVNGGSILALDNGILGLDASVIGAAIVTGSGSQFNVTSNFVVGESGSGIMTVSEGGALSIIDSASAGYPYFALGLNEGSHGDVAVTGSGSTLSSDDDIFIGFDGSGTLTLTDSASASTGYNGVVGLGADSIGEVTVENGAEWIIENDLIAGDYGQGSVLVQSGGSIEVSDDIFVGDETSGNGEITVTGVGSLLSSIDDVRIGVDGYGTLNISDGAEVRTGFTDSSSDGIGSIGHSEDSFGEVIVEDVGTWSLENALIVGRRGQGDVLIQRGGSIDTDDEIVIGSYSTGNGSMIVTGSDSLLDVADDLIIGDEGYGMLEVSDNATVNAYFASIGESGTGEGLVVVKGGASLNVGDFDVGDEGIGNLYIQDSGVVTSDYGVVGVSSTGVGNVVVEDNGQWTLSNMLFIGAEGKGTVLVQTGGILNASGINISPAPDGSGELVVSNSGTVTTTGDISVGTDAAGTMNITDRGVVNTGAEAYVGNGPTGVGTVAVRGSGSEWNITQSLTLGNEGGVGTVSVSEGGRLNIGRDIRINDGSTLNVTVDGDDVITTGLSGEAGWGDFYNFGLINIIADANLAAGSYTPFNIGNNYYNNGTIVAVGGLWDDNTREFSVSAITTDGTGDLSGKRVSYSDSLVVSFGSDVGTQTFEVTDLNVEFIDGQEVLGAYSFDTTITELTSLSFDVGTGLDADSIIIWHLADGATEWTLFNPDFVEYLDGNFAFTVSSFSSYALTSVPEPSTYALILGCMVVGLLIRRQKKMNAES